jgi:hypothetical protein
MSLFWSLAGFTMNNMIKTFQGTDQNNDNLNVRLLPFDMNKTFLLLFWAVARITMTNST